MIIYFHAWILSPILSGWKYMKFDLDKKEEHLINMKIKTLKK